MKCIRIGDASTPEELLSQHMSEDRDEGRTESKYALAEDLKSRGLCGTIFVDGWGDEAICILPQPCEKHAFGAGPSEGVEEEIVADAAYACAKVYGKDDERTKAILARLRAPTSDTEDVWEEAKILLRQASDYMSHLAGNDGEAAEIVIDINALLTRLRRTPNAGGENG